MYYDAVIVQFAKMLTNLSGLIDLGLAHADAKKFDPQNLLDARLVPDQFSFIRQVQIACDTAKLGASRLTGKPAPSHPDTERTAAELKTRIEETIAYLATYSEADFADSGTILISQPRWEGKTLTGEQYFMQHVIPNFYFHVTTAYSVLRAAGVDVGKRAYLGPMPYAAPGR